MLYIINEGNREVMVPFVISREWFHDKSYWQHICCDKALHAQSIVERKCNQKVLPDKIIKKSTETMLSPIVMFFKDLKKVSKHIQINVYLL